MPQSCWAKFEFVAENEDELYFGVGEKIEIIERDEAYGDGWWRGRTADGKEGLFPMSYITETEPVKTAAQSPVIASAPAPITATPPSPTSPSIPLQARALSRSPSPTHQDGAMGKTITDINKAIDSIASPDADSDDEDYQMGIGHSTRAKLAEQARIENEQQEKERSNGNAATHRRTSSGFRAHTAIAGNPAGLVYSDESEDEEEDLEREREPSMVPSSGFAALAAAAAGGVGAAASHLTGGLFTAPHEDVVSPKTEVIDMPPVPAQDDEVVPAQASPDRRGSFGQALAAQEPSSPVGLAISTDHQLPPPPSAPEAQISRFEPPETQEEEVIKERQAEPEATPVVPPVPVQPEVESIPDPAPSAAVPEVTSEPVTEMSNLSVQDSEVAAPLSEPPVPVIAPTQTTEVPEPPAPARTPSPTPAPVVLAPSPVPAVASIPSTEEAPASAVPASSNSPSIAPAILAPLAAAPIAVAAVAAARDPSPVTPAAVTTPAAAPTPAPVQVNTHSRTLSLNSPSTPVPGGHPSTWSVEQVVEWARSRDFDDAVCAKFQEHEISGDLLLELDANLLKELEIPQFGKRLRIAQAIGELRGERRTRPPSIDHPASGTASPAAVGDEDYAWHGSRKGSVIDSPIAAPIHEEEESNDLPSAREAPSIISAHSRASSMPASPVTPGGKRSSAGSAIGHKKNKPSVDKPASERMSFFSVNRARKPPPREDEAAALEKNRSLSRLGFSTANRPSKGPAPSAPSPPAQRLSVTPQGAETVLDKIGKPDHAGYMKKKGERYNSWKMRYFVLRGPHLYYMRSEQETRAKGHIDLTGHRVVVDENVHAGEYGFRIVGGSGDKTHAFSSPEQAVVRGWMKALIKATIARDYSAPVVSSCNIPTIPLIEAQAMSPAPRPPSPTQRDATQRATRRDNVNQLTPRDANVLMSLDGGLDSGHKRRVSGLGVPQPTPPRPSRELRRPSGRSVASVYEPEPAAAPARSDVVQWVNSTVPALAPTQMPSSFTNGLVITRLAEKLANAKERVDESVFAPTSNGAPSVDGLFAMMDTLIDHGFDTVGVSPGDVLGGDVDAITRLLASMRAWRGDR